MGRIKKLSQLVVNQIAAGEVVERPASVLKELLENSIDAGAKRIDVFIEKAGKTLIKVVDDGCGIEADDMLLAFESHATSKLQNPEDLGAISTMGFRGEAIASISSVADVAITSKTEDAEEALRVESVLGIVGVPEPAARARGTTIEVRDIFANIPARRKFLKTDNTEWGHVLEAFQRVALPNYKVEFRLHRDGREVFRLPNADLPIERIENFVGDEISSKLLKVRPLSNTSQKYGVKPGTDLSSTVVGYIGAPELQRPGAQQMYLFLNGRFIKDRVLISAVNQGYSEFFPSGKYPVVYLFLTISPEQFDVNVHPAKLEVRFADSRLVYALLRDAVALTLSHSKAAPKIPVNPHAPSRMPEQQVLPLTDVDRTDLESREKQTQIESLKTAVNELYERNREARSRPALRFDEGHGFSSKSSGPSAGTVAQNAGFSVGSPEHGFAEAPGRSDSGPPDAMSREEKPEITEIERQLSEALNASSKAAKPGVIPGNAGFAIDNFIQVHEGYIVFETPEGIGVIDQHALHERVLYNKLKKKFSAGRLESQRLLLPILLDLTPAEQIVFRKERETLEKLGFQFSHFGGNTFAVQSTPVIASKMDVPDFIRGFLAESEDRDESDVTDAAFVDAMIDMMACRSAIKMGMKLPREEIANLMREAEFSSESVYCCAHGRPTRLVITLKDLEKNFKRR
ncbi:MAG: DNA mismatch repair endonuclease MutL [Planctomycetes bacterium]|nr:DNA mismatch repair endonuclease MutL [Planctomycetota bacterium]